MRILILSQWFDPEPTFKGLAFAKELVRLGHKVEVLTGFPNYPGGRLYLGYKVRLFQRESIEGVSVIRVPLYPSHNSSSIKRIFNYISFSFSAALLGVFLVRKADVAYVYHPPATIGLPAIVLKYLRGIPFVYDVQDLWPDTLAATGMLNSPTILRLVGIWCQLLYIAADHIVVLSPGFKRIIHERGIHTGKISVIYNWCDESKLNANLPDDAALKQMGLVGKLNLVFAGTMGKAQGLEKVIEAAALLQDRYPNAQFVFVGGGVEVENLKRMAEKSKVHNVVFLPRRPVNEIGGILAAAEVLLVHLKDDPLFEITIPSKIQAYMLSGRPILLGGRGDAAELLKKSGAGVVCEPESPKSIASAAEALLLMSQEKRRKMGEAGRAYYNNELSLAAGVRKFEGVFSSVAKRI